MNRKTSRRQSYHNMFFHDSWQGSYYLQTKYWVGNWRLWWQLPTSGVPTCGMWTTSGTRRSSRWWAKTSIFSQNLDFTAF